MGKDDDDAELRDIRGDAFDDETERKEIRQTISRGKRAWRALSWVVVVAEHPRLVMALGGLAILLNAQGLWTWVGPILASLGVGK